MEKGILVTYFRTGNRFSRAKEGIFDVLTSIEVDTFLENIEMFHSCCETGVNVMGVNC